jgi:hypothetical protein
MESLVIHTVPTVPQSLAFFYQKTTFSERSLVDAASEQLL